nr:hypothetical protein [Tanacetum cinerariifolium]GEZ02296.1 hypothetical protein [Tanacetum cinerariifolium]
MDLRDDREAANTKLKGLNALIAQAEEEIETKEAQMEVMNGAIFIVQYMVVKLSQIVVKTVCVIVGRLSPHLRESNWRLGIVKMFQFKFVKLCFALLSGRVTVSYMGYLWVDRVDKMKLWFMRAHTEEHSFSMVIRDFCFELKVTLSQNWRLIAELEALGQRGDALKALEGLREIVARDVVKLEVLEQLLAATRVGIPLKPGYAADMEDKE